MEFRIEVEDTLRWQTSLTIDGQEITSFERGPAAGMLKEILTYRRNNERQEHPESDPPPRQDDKDRVHLPPSLDLMGKIRAGEVVFRRDDARSIVTDDKFSETWIATVNGATMTVVGRGRIASGLGYLDDVSVTAATSGTDKQYEVQCSTQEARDLFYLLHNGPRPPATLNELG